ncbi:MAG: hypothetical protein RR998_03650 [Oscillospiraceae bacterium]
MNKLKLNTKGMTVVEMVVVMSIMMIVMGVTAAMILSSSNLLSKSSDISIDKYIGDAVFNFTENRVKYATELSIKDSGATPTSRAITVDGTTGHLATKLSSDKFEDIYGDEFYLGRTVELYVLSTTDFTAELAVKVFRRGETDPSYSTGSIVRIVNMGRNKNKVVDSRESGQQALANPVIDFMSASTAAGGYTDAQVNELSILIDVRNGQYEELRRLLSSPPSGVTREDIKHQIRDYFNISLPFSNEFLSNEDFREMSKSDIGGFWKPLDPAVSAQISTGRIGELYVQPYVVIKNGYRDHVVYFATPDNVKWGGWRAYLIYNTRDNCWYCHGTPGAPLIYSMANDYSQNGNYDRLLAELETGNWVKIEKP